MKIDPNNTWRKVESRPRLRRNLESVTPSSATVSSGTSPADSTPGTRWDRSWAR